MCGGIGRKNAEKKSTSQIHTVDTAMDKQYEGETFKDSFKVVVKGFQVSHHNST